MPRRIAVLAPGRRAGPPVVWLGGFRSDMRSTKAEALDAWAASERPRLRALRLLRPRRIGRTHSRRHDLALARGHACRARRLRPGAAHPGRLVHGRLACAAGRRAPHAPSEPDRAPAGLVLIAPAVDFTERLMWAASPRASGAGDRDTGVYHRPSLYSDEPYPITRGLIEDGRQAPAPRRRRSRPAARSTSCRACRTPTCPGATRSSSSSTCRATACR